MYATSGRRGRLRHVLAATAVSAASVLGPSPAAKAQSAERDGPVLADEAFIPRLIQHDKPSPWPVLPMVDFGGAPLEMPYRQDNVKLDAGVLAPLLESSRAAKVGAGYAGAGDAFQSHAQAAHRTSEFLVMGGGAYERAGNYEDGAGNEVRFGYERHSEQLVVGWTPAGRSLKAMVLNDVISDHQNPLAAAVKQSGVNLIEGFGADPVETQRIVGRLTYEDSVSFGAVEKVKVEASYAGLDRQADNYTLRDTATANRMRADPSADILGLTASTDFRAGGFYNRVAVEARHTGQDGTRYGGSGVNDLDQITGYQYPGVSMWEAALVGESAFDFSPDRHLTFGLRYDVVQASANNAESWMSIGSFSGTPLSLYRHYYGDVDTDGTDHGVSARAKFQQDFLGDRANAYASLARVFRAADAQERFFALPTTDSSGATGTSSRQVGNPDLAPEYHHRFDLGGEIKGAGWRDWGQKGADSGTWVESKGWKLSALAYADYVKDFITRDRAHGQDGVLQSDNAAIWRNADAVLLGFEIDAQWNLTRNLSTRLNVAYTYGDNLTDDRPLYSIDPLEANLVVDYHDQLGGIGTWHVGGKLRAVAGQERVDDDPSTGSGYDVVAQEAFALLDLYAAIQLHDRFGVRVGVDNVLNKTYYENNYWLATDESNASQVYGPGRYYYIRTVATF